MSFLPFLFHSRNIQTIHLQWWYHRFYQIEILGHHLDHNLPSVSNLQGRLQEIDSLRLLTMLIDSMQIYDSRPITNILLCWLPDLHRSRFLSFVTQFFPWSSFVPPVHFSCEEQYSFLIKPSPADPHMIPLFGVFPFLCSQQHRSAPKNNYI